MRTAFSAMWLLLGAAFDQELLTLLGHHLQLEGYLSSEPAQRVYADGTGVHHAIHAFSAEHKVRREDLELARRRFGQIGE